MLGAPIAAGALLYGATRRRHEVVFDGELRSLAASVAAQVRTLFATGRTPAPRYDPEGSVALSEVP